MIRRPVAILVLLTSLNFVNYLDRYELAAVLTRIQADLHLSNFQGGLLFTTFLLSFLATSPLFGFLGDRMPRKYLLALGAFGWSIATIGTGLANSVWTLFLARTFVGIGEASFTTLAPTVIDDIAPATSKARWLSIFSIAGPVGSALGFIVGGILAKSFGWHAAFFVGGVPGILLGVLVLMMVEPERGVRETPRVLESLKTLLSIGSYRRAVAGYAALTFTVGGFAAWAPAFLHKRFGYDEAKGSILFGALTVIGGTIATLWGGSSADRAQRAVTHVAGDTAEAAVDQAKVRALLKVCARGSAFAAPLALVCFFAPMPAVFFVAAFFCEIGIFWSNAPINAAILRAVPNSIRASAMAISITSIHLFGDLWSPSIIGKLADLTGDAHIQYALVPLPLALVLSAVFWWPRASTAEAGPADR